MSSDPLAHPSLQSQPSHTAPPTSARTVASALEVIVSWGESILHVAQLVQPRDFVVGEADTLSAPEGIDFVIGRESLGVERLPVLRVEAGMPNVVFGAGALGQIELRGHTITLQELEQQGLTRALLEPVGAREYELPVGATAWVQHGAFTFVIRPSSALRWAVPRTEPLSVRRYAGALGSLLLHALLLIWVYLLPPRSAALSIDRLAQDGRYSDYLVTPLTRPAIEDAWPEVSLESADAAQGGSGQAHEGDRGQAGDPTREPVSRRFAVRAQRNRAEPELSRATLEQRASQAGIIGVLHANAQAQQAPSSPFARDQAQGNDSMDALGRLWSVNQGFSFGIGGLGSIGTGRGGGGRGRGTIGTGELGTIGRGDGSTGTGIYGSGAGGLHGRDSRVPQVRSLPAEVLGSLSKETIRRHIGRHINEVRSCYEQALITRPDLQGRIAIWFVIAGSGAVKNAAVASSDVADPHVASCIAAAVRRWTFPQPEGGGLVTVTYPFVLSQVGD